MRSARCVHGTVGSCSDCTIERLVAERNALLNELDLVREVRQKVQAERDEARAELAEVSAAYESVRGDDLDQLKKWLATATADRDAALALLRKLRGVVLIADAPEDVVQDWLAEIDAMLGGK